MKSYKDLKKDLLSNKRIKRQYDLLGPEFEMIQKLIEVRLTQGMTQADLAKKMGTKQSAISRFESGTYNPSLQFLLKVADALGVTLNVTVV